MFSSTPTIVIRSLISKIVPKTELGKVFSLLSSLEAAVPLIISPIVVNIYKATIDQFPGSVFAVFSGIYALVSITLLLVYLILKHSTAAVGYEPLHDDAVQANEADSSPTATT